MAAIRTIPVGPSEDLTWSGGLPETDIDVQASVDLVNWTTVARLAFDAYGVARITPPGSAYFRSYAPAVGQCGDPVRVIVTEPPATAVTPPPVVTSPFCNASECDWRSDNWSGYLVEGGPFTTVSGTFSVPNLVVSPTLTEFTAWVGIDGINTSSLIQAGVSESTIPDTTLVRYRAWWEILPEEPAMVEIDWRQLSVMPGDTVSVAIWQTADPSYWAIWLSDATTGQVFSTVRSYRGPQATAEWIVEAPGDLVTGEIEVLGAYSPAVTFTNLRVTGPFTSTIQGFMNQGGTTVSTPSVLTANGFSVAYGDTPPPWP